jgi:phage baseplate assembly protein W
MFPQTQSVNNIQSQSEIDNSAKTYLFDFEKGDFVVKDGKLIECDGIEAIKVWIEKILRTEKGRFAIFDDTDYGCHIEDLIVGNNYPVEYIEAELKREIEEALLLNSKISSVNNFKITRTRNNLIVEMEVHTDDAGESIITVTV